MARPPSPASRARGPGPGTAEGGAVLYSLLTVLEVKAANPGADVLFVIGADAFSEIASWHRYRELLEACDFLLLPRRNPGRNRFPAESFLNRRKNRC